MRKVKKSISIILAVLMICSVFSVLSVTAQAKDTDKSKTGGMFPTITLAGDKDVTILDWNGVNENAMEGVSYNKSTNTLSLYNANLLGTYGLETYFMGEDFNLQINGECSLSYILMRDGCLSITGKGGSLTVGKDVENAISFEARAEDYYPSALSISDTVSVKFTGTKSAFTINQSSAEKVAFAGGEKISGVKSVKEYQDGETKKINSALAEKQSVSYYLATVASDPHGTYCVCDFYDEDDNMSFEVSKCTYNDELEGYLIDDSFEPVIVDYDDFGEEGCDYGYARDEDGYRIWIDCYKWDYDGANVLEDEDGNQFAEFWWDIYDFSEDKTITHNGEKYYVLTRNYDVYEGDLTPVIDEITLRYYDYEYDGTVFEYCPDWRGKASAIYVDNGEDSYTIFEKPTHDYDTIEGISFDKSTHTLTLQSCEVLEKFKSATLAVYYMGDDFTINVEGSCELGGINVYRGSLTIAGEGTLTINSSSDYGITVEPYETDYNASSITFADSVSVNIRGAESAFCVKNTTLEKAEAVKNADDLKQSNDTLVETDKKVSGGILEQWSGDVGYRYKVLNHNEPDALYCARGYSTTTMNAYGQPDKTINYFEIKKCHYDEKCGKNIIDSSVGTLTEDEFNAAGYYRIELEGAGISPYTLMSAYYVSRMDATAYKDAQGNKYAASDTGDVYAYSEDKLVTHEGNDIYLFEPVSDVEVDSLNKEKDNLAYRTFLYNGTEFVKEKSSTPTDPTSAENPTGVTEPSAPSGETEPSKPAGETEPYNPDYTIPVTEPIAQKQENPIKVTSKDFTFNKNDFSKTLGVFNPITVKDAQGKVSFALVSGASGYITLHESTGRLTLSKSMPNGSYTIKVKVEAAGNSTYNSKTVLTTVNFKVTGSDSSVTNKKDNTLKVSTKTKSVKAKKLMNKKQTVKPLKIKDAKGAVTVVKVKSGTNKKIFKKIKVNKKTGAITIKKGKYAKKTYKIKLKITAKGNSAFKPKTITKIVKVKVK